MAKSIITQDGDIVNYGNLVAIYVEDDLDDDENVLGYELLGLTGGGKDADIIILGRFSNAESALKARYELICWLQSEAFGTFEMPKTDKGGDA